MKRAFSLLGIALALSLASAPRLAIAGEVLDRIMSAGEIKIATDSAWPPYSWKDEAGKWQGFDVAVAGEIAKRMDVKLTFVAPVWDDITAGNWNGAWDLSVGSMSPTEERSKVLVFPKPYYYYSPMVLAVQKDNTSIKSPGDAAGKRIGAVKGSIFEKYIRHESTGMADEAMPSYKISDAEIVTFEAAGDASNALVASGDAGVDGMVDDLMYFLFLIKDGAPIKVVGQPLSYGPAALAIEPGDAEFEALLGDTITAMKADGTLPALSNKWFGVDLTQKF